MPAFSFIATAETVVLVGATPVYVDIDPKTYNLDVTQLEKALSSKTKAIQPVSLYGQPAEMDEINAFAQKHNLLVIEDAAQSFGATYKGKRSCNLAHAGVTSFFPAKPLGVTEMAARFLPMMISLPKQCAKCAFMGKRVVTITHVSA